MNEKVLLYTALGVTAAAAVFGVYSARGATSGPAPRMEISPISLIESSKGVVPAEVPIRLTASDGTGLRLVSLKAEAAVEDPLALTELHLTFENPQDRILEGTFRITLPQGASLSRFAMKVNGAWQEGEVVEKQAARQAYEDFLHRRQDPALMEQGAGNEFSARVFPIPARGTKEIIVTYSETIAIGASYTLPLRGLPQLGTLDVNAHVAGKNAAAMGGKTDALYGIHETRFTPGGDFVVDARQVPRSPGLRAGNLAITRVIPFATSRPEPLGSAVVLVDTSASRGLGIGDQAKAVQDLLAKLPSDTLVSVACFDQDVSPLYEGKASGFGAKEIAAIVTRGALGASDFENAIGWAGTEAKRRKATRIVFVTDGVATAGETDGQKLRLKVEALRDAGVTRMDAIAIGGIRDDAFLKTVVRGVLDRDGVVLDAKLGPEALARRLGEATSSGVAVKVDGARWSYPDKLDGLQAGDEILVFAELDGTLPVKIDVGGQQFTPDLRTIERPLVERAWAQAKIQSLLDAPLDNAAATKQQIVALSTEHRVLSPYTALLVLENDWDYRRFNIDRNAKVDILTVQDGRVAITESGRTRDDEPRIVDLPVTRGGKDFAGKTATASAAIEQKAEPHKGASAASEEAPSPQAMASAAPPPPAMAMPAPTVAPTALPPIQPLATATVAAGDTNAAPVADLQDRAPRPGLEGVAQGTTGNAGGGSADGLGRGLGAIGADPRSAGPGNGAPADGHAAPASQPQAVANAEPASPPRAMRAPAMRRPSMPPAHNDMDEDAPAPAASGQRHRSVTRGDAPPPPPPPTQRSVGGGAIGMVRPTTLAVDHGMSADEAQRVIRGAVPRYRQCYQTALGSDPSVHGSMSVRYTVDATGTVIGADVTGPGNDALHACVGGVSKRLSFPAPGLGNAVFTQSFDFVGGGNTDSATEGQQAGQTSGVAPYEGRFKTVMADLSTGNKDGALDEANRWHADQPGDILSLVALGEVFEARNELDQAARAYGSILELFSFRADSRRFAGERLERLKNARALALAVDTYGKAVEERPDHPASHRLYAYALLKAGQPEKAFEAIRKGSQRTYPAGRFRGVDRILKEDMGLIAAAWTHAEPGRAAEIKQKLHEGGGTEENAPSLRFVLVWETDANDVDFHIHDGKGGHAFYSQMQLPSGGELYADVTTGYGPECFTIRNPHARNAYPYMLQAHYYSRGPMGYGMGKLEILEHDGKGNLSFAERPFVVMVDHAYVDMGTVDKNTKLTPM